MCVCEEFVSPGQNESCGAETIACGSETLKGQGTCETVNDACTLSDDCWDIPVDGCTSGDNTARYTGKINTETASNKKTVCLNVPPDVCPTRVCTITGYSPNDVKNCYDIKGLTCTYDGTTSECATWDPTSGVVCIAAPVPGPQDITLRSESGTFIRVKWAAPTWPTWPT